MESNIVFGRAANEFASAVETAVRNGHMKAGDRLPPVRDLASASLDPAFLPDPAPFLAQLGHPRVDLVADEARAVHGLLARLPGIRVSIGNLRDDEILPFAEAVRDALTLWPAPSAGREQGGWNSSSPIRLRR